MSLEIYERNLESIKNWVDTWEVYLREKKYEENKEIEIQIEKAMSGDTIFSVIDANGKKLYLSGKYNPRRMAEDWILKKEIQGKNVLVFVLGFGDGIFIKELLRLTGKDTKILVYEPCVDVFVKAIQEVDLTEIFDSKRVGLIIETMNREEWNDLLETEFSLEKVADIYTYANVSYQRLYPEEMKKALREVREHFLQIQVNWNTRMRYTAHSGVNLISNLKYLKNSYTINSLYHRLPETFPCIIVAAGPSLNKNIEDLKLVQKRACIIACDTAMKPLLSHGIIPDFFLVVDAKKPKLLLDYPGVEKVPFVTSLEVPKDIMEFHVGKKFFYYCGEEILRKVVDAGFKDRKKPVPIEEGVSFLKTGGSVATSAYALAEFMGSRTIILIGQDLAFTNKKSHADGTFDDNMEEIEDISRFAQVEDIYGEMVYTPIDMKEYLKWYEKEIAAHPDYEVIDATEGGARIKGTKIMTLKDAIEMYCHQEIDIQQHLEEVPELFREEEKEYVETYLKQLPKMAQEVLKQVIKTKKDYRKLANLSIQKNKDAEIVKLSKKISKTVKELEKNEVYLFMVGFMAGFEYTFRGALNQEEENEMLAAANQGELYLQVMENILNLTIPLLDKECI